MSCLLAARFPRPVFLVVQFIDPNVRSVRSRLCCLLRQELIDPRGECDDDPAEVASAGKFYPERQVVQRI